MMMMAGNVTEWGKFYMGIRKLLQQRRRFPVRSQWRDDKMSGGGQGRLWYSIRRIRRRLHTFLNVIRFITKSIDGNHFEREWIDFWLRNNYDAETLLRRKLIASFGSCKGWDVMWVKWEIRNVSSGRNNFVYLQINNICNNSEYSILIIVHLKMHQDAARWYFSAIGSIWSRYYKRQSFILLATPI